jgi:hypothetical protein
MKTLCQFLQDKQDEATDVLGEKIAQMSAQSGEATMVFDEILASALSVDEIGERNLKVAAKNFSDEDVTQEIRENAKLMLEEISGDLYGEESLSRLTSDLTAIAQSSFGTWSEKEFYASLHDLHSAVAGKYTADGRSLEDYAETEISAHINASLQLLNLSLNRQLASHNARMDLMLEEFYDDFTAAETALNQVIVAGEEQWLRWENTFNEEYAQWRRDFSRANASVCCGIYFY